jgi:hypothetical protein
MATMRGVLSSLIEGATFSYASGSSYEYGTRFMSPFRHLEVLRRLPDFLKTFKLWAKASCTLHTHLHCKTNGIKSGVVLQTMVQMSFMLRHQARERSSK